MKFAIIAGVIHMLVGIVLKISNGLYFNNYTDIIFEAVP